MRGVGAEEISRAARYVVGASSKEFDGPGSSDAERGILQVRERISPKKFMPVDAGKACASAAAVDGGSAIIIDCGSFVVGALSVGHVIADGKGAVKSCQSNIRILPVSHADKNSVYASIFKSVLGCEPPDSPSTLESLVGRARNIEELLEAEELLGELPKGSLLMIDGSLWAGTPGLAPLVERIADLAERRGVCLAGVSKRSMLYTGHRPLVPYLARLGRKEMGRSCWAYPVNLEEYAGKLFGVTYVARLHPMADFAFRIDVLPVPDIPAGDALSMLSSLSDDPGYLGYPYPLARVHNEVAITEESRGEIEAELMRAVESEGGDIQLIQEFVQDFHDILDGGR